MADPLPWDQITNSDPLSTRTSEPTLIIGAGLAGCWLARTLAESGINVNVIDAGSQAASAASSNPAGIVKPFVTRSPSFAMSFYLQAHEYLLQRLKYWELGGACDYQECGVLQLVKKSYPPSRHYICVKPQDMQSVSGIKIDSDAILFERAGWLNPGKLCRQLLKHPLIEQHFDCEINKIDRTSTGWQIQSSSAENFHTSHLVIATGASITKFKLTEQLDLTPARGQISRFALKLSPPETVNTCSLKRVVSGKHYVIPDTTSLIVGASFDRNNDDSSVRQADNKTNSSGLQTMLPAARICDTATEAFAGVRATTPDRLPLIGPVPDINACVETYRDISHGRKLSCYPILPIHKGAFVLGGLGSRGIVTAPFAASLLADFMTGGHELMPWATLVNPVRFKIRKLKRTPYKHHS